MVSKKKKKKKRRFYLFASNLSSNQPLMHQRSDEENKSQTHNNGVCTYSLAQFSSRMGRQTVISRSIHTQLSCLWFEMQIAWWRNENGERVKIRISCSIDGRWKRVKDLFVKSKGRAKIIFLNWIFLIKDDENVFWNNVESETWPFKIFLKNDFKIEHDG